jgi:hypothetical protein
MPAADSCDAVRVNHFTFSHGSVTRRRSPEVSSTAFRAPPPDLPPALLMDMGFAVMCPLAQRRRPHYLVLVHRLAPLLHASSDSASRRRPCASLSLLLHQDVKRTCTSKLLNMLGTQWKKAHSLEQAFVFTEYRLLATDLPLSTCRPCRRVRLASPEPSCLPGSPIPALRWSASTMQSKPRSAGQCG